MNLSQRINDYLNGLRNEFEAANATSMNGSSARRFNLYLGHLKGEFEFLSLEIESLEKERDDYKAKDENCCHNICDRCGHEIATAPLVLSSQATSSKKESSLFSRAFFRFRSRTSRRVDQETTTRLPAQNTALIKNLQSQPVSHTRPLVNIAACSGNVALPASSEWESTPTVDADSGPQTLNWSITYNNEVGKELDMELTHVLRHQKLIFSIYFSQDGKSLAAGCYDGKAYIYDVDTGRLTYALGNVLEEDDSMGGAVCFSRGGKYLATNARNGNIFIWQINTKYVRNVFRGHTHYISAVQFSPDDRLLVSASYDNTVRLWNMRDGTSRSLTDDNPTFIDGPYYSCADFSPDGQYIAASHRDGIVRIWDVRTGRLMRRVFHGTEWEMGIKFLPDGKGLVSGGGSGYRNNAPLKFWDISSSNATARRTTNKLHRQHPGVEEQIEPERVFSGHLDGILCVSLSHDGIWVASGSSDNCVRIWDTRNAAMQCSFDVIHGPVCSVGFSPAGGHFASGGKDGYLRIWKYTHIPRGESRVHSSQLQLSGLT